jgi:protein SCO1
MSFARSARWIVAGALSLAVLAACGIPAGHAERSADAASEQRLADHDHRGASHAADTAAHDHGPAHDHQAATADAMPATDPADFSIYHAQSVWTDQLGERRPLDSLAGRVQVVGMVYTSCAYACPRMMLDMKRIEGELVGDAEVGFVLVSIDPERDTPERLADYARGARLDPDRWTLLHGDPGDILELAALLGVQYRRMADGEFVHSNFLTILDAQGRVVHRQMGLGADPRDTLEVIRSLAG